MKKLATLVIFIVVIGFGYYLIRPLFLIVEIDEPSPLDIEKVETVIKNEVLDTMDEETRKAFIDEMSKVMDKEIKIDEPMPKVIVKTENREENEEKIQKPEIVSEGEFKGEAHHVNGKALLIKRGEDHVLRFEDFNTINGPNLHVYLASNLNGKDFVDLGKLKATKGNINYDLSPDIDTKYYNKVLIWCVPFKVLFSYAQI